MPRPTRTLRWREPRGGRRLERFTAMCASIPRSIRPLVDHNNQVPYLMHHAADRGRILAFDNLLQPAKTQPANGLPHIARAADIADDPLNLERSCFFVGHLYSSFSSFSSFFPLVPQLVDRLRP